MLEELLCSVTLYKLLEQIDQDLANLTREARCPYCMGPLHLAKYTRKPRGGPDLPEKCCIRLSLCCGWEGCRRRVLPPSCLFCGRRVYWHLVILIIIALKEQRAEGCSARRIRRKFGISRKTLNRWFVYYQEVFPQTPWWQQLRGLVGVEVSDQRLPVSLLEHFISHSINNQHGLVKCLCFLATGQSDIASRYLMEGRVHAKDGVCQGIIQ